VHPRYVVANKNRQGPRQAGRQSPDQVEAGSSRVGNGRQCRWRRVQVAGVQAGRQVQVQVNQPQCSSIQAGWGRGQVRVAQNVVWQQVQAGRQVVAGRCRQVQVVVQVAPPGGMVGRGVGRPV